MKRFIFNLKPNAKDCIYSCLLLLLKLIIYVIFIWKRKQTFYVFCWYAIVRILGNQRAKQIQIIFVKNLLISKENILLFIYWFVYSFKIEGFNSNVLLKINLWTSLNVNMTKQLMYCTVFIYSMCNIFWIIFLKVVKIFSFLCK